MKNRPEFAAYVAKLLKRAGDDRALRFDEDQFALIGADGSITNLHNVYAYYCKAGFFSRGKIVKQHVHGIVAAGREAQETLGFDAVRGRLVMLVRSAGYIASFTAMAEASGWKENKRDRPMRPVGDGMFAMLAVDGDQAVSFVAGGAAEEWGQSDDELFKIARFNLRMKNPSPFVPVQPGLFAASNDDYLDSGRILLTEVVARLPVRGETIAMVPNPALALVADSDDDAALARMAQIAERALEDPKWISGELLLLQGEAWVPYSVRGTGSGARHLRKVATLSRARAYEEQRDALQAQVGEAYYVASTMVFEHTDGSVHSLSTVTEDVPTYLPRTDRVQLVSNTMIDVPGTPPLPPVDWEQLERLVGPLEPAPGISPTRYLIDRFPDVTTLVGA